MSTNDELVIEPAGESLEDVLARITADNRHDLVLDGPAAGPEAW